jgi:hypothetical protein
MQPVIVLDLDERVLVLGAFRLPGNVSGVELDQEFAQLVTRRGALVTHDRQFVAWDRGCEPQGSTRMPSPSPRAEKRGKRRAAPGRARSASEGALSREAGSEHPDRPPGRLVRAPKRAASDGRPECRLAMRPAFMGERERCGAWDRSCFVPGAVTGRC